MDLLTSISHFRFRSGFTANTTKYENSAPSDVGADLRVRPPRLADRDVGHYSSKAISGVILAITIASLMLWGCGASQSHTKPDPAVAQKIDQNRYLLKLIPRAEERLKLQTAVVQTWAGNRVAIPYSAVMYLPDGTSWTYTRSARLEYIRQHISVEAVNGDEAILSEGPAPGSEVVTVGVSELWGIESGVGE